MIGLPPLAERFIGTDWMTDRRRQLPRMGALPPRYSFLLNPHASERFTRCPRCNATTRLRKIPLVVHVDSFGLVLLRKTCRLCLVCDMLIVHETEMNGVINNLASASDVRPEFVVLGTLGSGVWRKGLGGGATIQEVKDDMADFKAYMRVDITPRHWEGKRGPAN